MHRDGDNRQAGFTLLEIIVALVVFGFLLIGLNAGTRTGLALWNAQARRVGQTEELDAIERMLRAMLTAMPILPISADNNAPQAIAITGDPAHLAFVGDLPTGLGAVGRVDITLKLNGSRLVLGWAPHRHEKVEAPPDPPDLPTEIALIGGIEHLEFAYLTVLSPGQAPLWVEKWDGPNLPLLIRLRLRFAKGDLRHWPDLVVAPQLAPPV
jgi:general secretion pathway protein J